MKVLHAKIWLKGLIIASFLVICGFSAQIDFAIAQFFYRKDAQGVAHFYQSALTDFLYTYGDKAGWLLAILGLIVYLLTLFSPRFKKWRPAALLLLLTFFIGAGLIVNGLFKAYWGRPRPLQVIEFGGKHTYRPFYQPNFHQGSEPEKSFPSGHTAMGFYFLTLCFIGKRYNYQKIYGWGVFFCLFLGCGLMITRIVQGGHFLTDTLFGMLIMWLTSYFFDWLLFEKWYSPATLKEYQQEHDVCRYPSTSRRSPE